MHIAERRAQVLEWSGQPDAAMQQWIALLRAEFTRHALDELRTEQDGDDMGPCVLAGPTCDSVDVLYEKDPYFLPFSLEIGSKVLIEGTGAYTTTYSAVGFNGFPPLETHVI